MSTLTYNGQSISNAFSNGTVSNNIVSFTREDNGSAGYNGGTRYSFSGPGVSAASLGQIIVDSRNYWIAYKTSYDANYTMIPANNQRVYWNLTDGGNLTMSATRYEVNSINGVIKAGFPTTTNTVYQISGFSYSFAQPTLSITPSASTYMIGSTYTFTVNYSGGYSLDVTPVYQTKIQLKTGSTVIAESNNSPLVYNIPDNLDENATHYISYYVKQTAGTNNPEGSGTQNITIQTLKRIPAIKTELSGNNFIVNFNTVSGFAYNYDLSSSGLTTQTTTSTTTQVSRTLALSLPNLNSSRTVTLLGKSGSTIATKTYTLIIPANPSTASRETILQTADKPFIYNGESGKRVTAKVSELSGITLDMQTSSGAVLKTYTAPSGVDKVNVAISERPSNAGGIIKELSISSVKLNSSGQRVYSTLNSTVTYSATTFTVPSNTTTMYIYWDPSGNDNVSQFKYLMKRENGVNYWNVAANLNLLASAVWSATAQNGITLTAGTPTGMFTYFGPSSTINIIYSSLTTSGGGQLGKYIRVTRTSLNTQSDGRPEDKNVINLAEIRGFDGNNNLIMPLTASSSGIYDNNSNYVPSKLINNDTSDMAATNNIGAVTGAWVEVEYSSTVNIHKVIINNRTSDQARSMGLTMTILDSNRNILYTAPEITASESTQSSFTYNIPSGGQSTNIPCFVAGTRILTPVGEKLVENLRTGDIVITADGRKAVATIYSTKIAKTTKENAPYLIPANTFRPHFPPQDICLSPKHAIQSGKGIWEIPQFAEGRFPAVQKTRIGESVTYYHIELPNFFTDNLIANGSVCESLGAKVQSALPKGQALYSFNKKLNGFTRYNPEEATATKKTK
jgi:hypothetical protein